MMKKRILIVEDDAALARVLRDNLTFEGFDAPTRFYGSSGADHFIGTKYNDWFLPSGGNDIIDGGSPPLGQGPFDFDVLSAGASALPRRRHSR